MIHDVVIPREQHEKLRSAFNKRDVALAMTQPVWFLLPGHALHWFLHGELARGGWLGLLIPWSLGVLWFPLLWRTRDQILQSEDTVPASMWWLGVGQIGWMLTITWFFTPYWSMVMVILIAALVVNDVRIFYDNPVLKRHLGLGLLWGWGALLFVDLLGGDGPIHRAMIAPREVLLMAAVHVVALVLALAVVTFIGRQIRESDEQRAQSVALEQQLAVFQRERELIQRSCDFMIQGVQASQFSHDVKSPLTVLGMLIWEFEGILPGIAEPIRSQLSEVYRDLQDVQSSLLTMTSEMVRALQTGVQSSPVRFEALIEESIASMEAALKAYDLPPPVIQRTIADLEVTVPGEIAAVIGNIVLNSRIYGSQQVDLTAWGETEEFAVLLLRDYAVSIDSRPEAMARVQSRLNLESPEKDAILPLPGETTRSYGLGLLLAKMQCLRIGGWLGVCAPSEGLGLVFIMVLPRVSLDAMPAEILQPEEITLQIQQKLAAGTLSSGVSDPA